MKKLTAALLLLSMLLAGVACTGEGETTTFADETTNAPEADVTEAPATESAETTAVIEETTAAPADENVLDKSKTYNILFVGNSYTHYNDMPEQILRRS